MAGAIIILAVVCSVILGIQAKPSQTYTISDNLNSNVTASLIHRLGRRGFRGDGPSADPISTTPPNLPGGTVIAVDDIEPGPFLQDFKPPFPTDTWWAGLTVRDQDAVAAGPFPFQSATKNTGLEFGISDERFFDGTSIHQRINLEWSLGFVGLPNILNNRKATSFDTQTVCLQYFNGGGSTTMDSCLVPGSPYMTATFQNAAVVLQSLKGPITDVEVVGTKAKLTLTGGATYILYAVGSFLELSLSADRLTLTSTAGFSGTIRLAKLKVASQEAALDASYQTIPTDVSMSYTVQGDVSTQTFVWATVGPAENLLIMSWPHHRKTLQGAINYVNIEYMTTKGIMRGILGNTWTLRHDLPTITWFAPNNPQPSCSALLEKTLEADVKALLVIEPGEFYLWGGAFARAAHLATIAEHVGRTDLIPEIVVMLKGSIQYWLQPPAAPDRPSAAYEKLWGGFVDKRDWTPGVLNWYNDHHYQYGYLLHGAAVIGKHDPGWLAQNIEFLLQAARDYGNPSPLDPHYTVTRHMDWFAQHSWASGLANGAGARAQESSSEAINGYYGLLLFAKVINHQALIDYSRMLLAIEMASTKMYWHLYPNQEVPDSPYPEQAFRDLVTVGNVMDAQAGAWLYWGSQHIQIAAIQILPLTPIGVDYFDQPWMEAVYPYCEEELNDRTIGDTFKSVIYAAYAVVNPQMAFKRSEDLITWGSGNSATNQLYFVSTVQSAADICTDIAVTPEGIYYIQDVATLKYVVVKGNGKLGATTGADVLASKFSLEFTPNGGTIRALSNNKYVTADSNGVNALSAIIDVPQSHEIFRWAPAADDTFELLAMVNRGLVSSSETGELINDGEASKYRLVVPEDVVPDPVPNQGTLKSVQTNAYVVAIDNTLMATAGSPAEATRWVFEPVPDTEYVVIRSQTTDLYVTGDPEGTKPLKAEKDSAGLWEYFQIVSYRGSFILVHVTSGFGVAVQPDNTLIDNNSAIDNAALWVIE